MLKSKTTSSPIKWQPSAAISHLRARAGMLKIIRDFFAARDVLEVETPLMCHTSVTDPFIQSVPALFQRDSNADEIRYYLQTSPEYAIKRLLAAGIGDVYQITKAFRQGEVGRFHNPEFTMLEWYRMGFDHHALMDEMDVLLQAVLQCPPAKRVSYGEMFQQFVGVNAFDTSVDELKKIAEKNNIHIESVIDDVDTWLDIIASHYIEPNMDPALPWFIYDFPASKAALARIKPTLPPTASRFEVYFKGIELANGFHELQNAGEQRARFEKNLVMRKEMGLRALPIDEFFLAALEAGLPDCSGVALGIDRLVMLALNAPAIADVVSFDFTRV